MATCETAASTMGSYEETGASGADERTGHVFAKKAFHKMAYCHHCGEMVWSFLGQAFQCEGKRNEKTDRRTCC